MDEIYQYQSELPPAHFFSWTSKYPWNLDLDWITSKSKLYLTYWKYYKCDIKSESEKSGQREQWSLQLQEIRRPERCKTLSAAQQMKPMDMIYPSQQKQQLGSTTITNQT